MILKKRREEETTLSPFVAACLPISFSIIYKISSIRTWCTGLPPAFYSELSIVEGVT